MSDRDKIGGLNPIYGEKFSQRVRTHLDTLKLDVQSKMIAAAYATEKENISFGSVRGVVVHVNEQGPEFLGFEGAWGVGAIGNNSVNIHVRIPEIHGYMLNPDPTKHSEEEMINIAKSYPIFIGTTNGDRSPVKGDIVLVDFYSNEKSLGGTYKSIVSKVEDMGNSSEEIDSISGYLGGTVQRISGDNFDLSMPDPNLSSVEIAIKEWERGVYEPPNGNWQRISSYIGKGLGWTDRIPYLKDKDFEWCGAFVSFCMPNILLKNRKEHFAGARKMRKWSEGNERRISVEEIRAGDIIISGKIPDGEHVSLCVGHGDGYVDSIDGNSFGPGPNGKDNKGVCKRRYKFVSPGNGKNFAQFGVRPLPIDYINGVKKP